MKPAKQTKDFSVCLYGTTLPSGVIYGNVSGNTYIYNPWQKTLAVWNGKKWAYRNPEKYHEIMHYVEKFIKSVDFDPSIPVRWCMHKHETRGREYAIGSRIANRRNRENGRVMREICPREKRPQTDYLYKPSSQSAVDGKGYSNKWEEDVPVQEEEDVYFSMRTKLQ